MTCVGAGSQAALVESLQEDPAHSAAGPTTEHPGDDIIEAEEGKSALRRQERQDEAALLHLSLSHPQKSLAAFY